LVEASDISKGVNVPQSFAKTSFGFCALRRMVMKKFLVCAALAMAATNLHAAIMYSASIGCQESCVTVALSWAAEPFAVNYAAVENSLDNVIFTFNLGPFAGQTTGSIVPSPQTFGPLSASDISEIRSGQAYVSLTSTAAGLLGGGDGPGTDGTSFFVPNTPEPAAWWLTAAGLALLFLRARTLGRKSRMCID
jgi:hypothetical protein